MLVGRKGVGEKEDSFSRARDFVRFVKAYKAIVIVGLIIFLGANLFLTDALSP